jgi:cytochrome c553
LKKIIYGTLNLISRRKMKMLRSIIFTLAALIIVACSSRKKNSTTNASTATTPTSTVSSGPIMISKSADGIYIPGDQELAAVQVQHKDATASQLKEGYELYSKTACVSCHEAKNIYKRPLERWKDIVDDMAQRAKITETQKDAVYKYVLSIKTTQPK